MKSRILTLVALFFAISVSGAYAQDNATIGAFASVIQDLEISRVQDLEFGNVGVDSEVTIDGKGGVTGGGGNQQQGIFTIVSAQGAQIELTFAVIEHLKGPGDDITIDLDFGTSGWYDDAGDEFFNASTPTTLFAPANSFNVGLGGSIETDEEQEAGLYQGEIQLTVEYL